MNKFDFSDFAVATLSVEDTNETEPKVSNPSSDNGKSYLRAERAEVKPGVAEDSPGAKTPV